MEINSTSSVPVALIRAETGDAVAIAVLKKAQEIEAQSAVQLINALPQPANNPPNLGNKVNTFA